MNKKIGLAVVLAMVLALVLLGCDKFETPPKAAEDEILLKIKLDIKEDIGLLVVDYDANGDGGSGGTSNANKSLLKHDELILYTLEKRCFDNPSDVKSLSLQFTIITAYFDPNYDNIYPEEYTKPLNAILLNADFGKSYDITITGDKTNGYTAILDE